MLIATAAVGIFHCFFCLLQLFSFCHVNLMQKMGSKNVIILEIWWSRLHLSHFMVKMMLANTNDKVRTLSLERQCGKKKQNPKIQTKMKKTSRKRWTHSTTVYSAAIINNACLLQSTRNDFEIAIVNEHRQRCYHHHLDEPLNSNCNKKCTVAHGLSFV